MHMTLNWCFTRVLIDKIEFNRCFIISSFNLATLQQFFKKRQNRRYYHFNIYMYTGIDSYMIQYISPIIYLFNHYIMIIKNESAEININKKLLHFSNLTKSDLYLHYHTEDLITPHYWSHSSELWINFEFAYCAMILTN